MAEETKPGIVFKSKPDLPPPSVAREEIVKAREDQTKEMTERVAPEKETPPLNVYRRVNGRPYSVDYFDLGPSWEFSNFPSNIEIVEDFVGEEIKRLGLKNTVDSYKEVVSKLESSIGTSGNEKTRNRINRLVTYIKTINNLKKYEERKLEQEAYGKT